MAGEYINDAFVISTDRYNAYKYFSDLLNKRVEDLTVKEKNIAMARHVTAIGLCMLSVALDDAGASTPSIKDTNSLRELIAELQDAVDALDMVPPLDYEEQTNGA